MNSRFSIYITTLFLGLLFIAPNAIAESDLEKRVIELEKKLDSVLKANSMQANPVKAGSVKTNPVKKEKSRNITKVETQASAKSSDAKSSNVDYKKGFILSSKKGDDFFSLKINGRLQARYVAFTRDDETFEFDNGTTGTQSNRSDFEIERARIEFSGNVGSPNLEFYINIDADTDDNHEAIFHDFWFNYNFAPEFNLYFGKAFVPGSREWLDGSTSAHLADRSLATSFFRPDRSIGIWSIGKIANAVNYRTMVSNGFITTDLSPSEVDNEFTYSTTFWGDIIGDYGKGRADLSYHEDVAVRLGASFTYSPVGDNIRGEPLDEAGAIRLSDGTRLDSLGALADGVTISEYDIFLYAIDLSAKYRGFSLNSEAYYREITSIQADGLVPETSYDDVGAYADIGYFLIPGSLEAVLRYSFIDGDIADSAEYAGGINYYINGTHKNKLTLDVAKLEDSPVSNSGPNFRVGDDGVMYRLQWQIAF